jgi:nucleoid-associated protein YgaU
MEPASGQQVAAAPATSTTTSNGTTVVQRTGRIIIQPGNNLWNISRVIYGQGLSYTTIYQANKEQIRNPDLIYPGQIFLTPGVTPPEEIKPEDRTPLPGAPDNG